MFLYSLNGVLGELVGAEQFLPVSMGPVLESTSYIYMTIFGVTIFRENLNRKKIAELGFIIDGIVVYSFLDWPMIF